MRELRRVYGDRKWMLFMVLAIAAMLIAFVIEQMDEDALPGGPEAFAEREKKYAGLVSEYAEMEPGAALRKVEGAMETFSETQDEERIELYGRLIGQLEYAATYQDYIQTVQKQAKRSGRFSFMNMDDSFTRRNVERTAAEFEALSGLSITIGNDQALVAFFRFGWKDALLSILAILVSMRFFTENEKLQTLIFATPRGRGSLAVRRVGILAFMAVASTLVIYGATFLASMALYGAVTDMSRPIQCLALFKTLTAQMSIVEFISQYALVRMASIFAVSLLFWFVFLAMKEIKVSMMVLCAFLLFEYFMYAYVPMQSVFCNLKYLNIFYLFSANAMYTDYINLNIFGAPIGHRLCMFALCALMVPSLAALCIGMSRSMNRRKIMFLSRALFYINRKADELLANCRLFHYELYKALVLKRGFLVFVTLAAVCYYAPYVEYRYMNDAQVERRNAIREYSGFVTPQTVEEIARKQQACENTIAEQSDALENAGYAQASDEDKMRMEARIMRAQSEQVALNQVSAEIERQQALAERTGHRPYILDEEPFFAVFGYVSENEEEMDQRTFEKQKLFALLAVLALLLLTCGIFPYEHQSGMKTLLLTSKRFERLWSRKIWLAGLFALAVWALVYIPEFYWMYREMGREALLAPIHSIEAVCEFPMDLSIAQFMALLNLVRLVGLVSCGIIALAFTANITSTMKAYIATCLLMVLPSAAYSVTGGSIWRYVSLSSAIPAIDTLLLSRGRMTQILAQARGLFGFAVFALGAAKAVYKSKGRWFRRYAPGPPSP